MGKNAVAIAMAALMTVVFASHGADVGAALNAAQKSIDSSVKVQEDIAKDVKLDSEAEKMRREARAKAIAEREAAEKAFNQAVSKKKAELETARSKKLAETEGKLKAAESKVAASEKAISSAKDALAKAKAAEKPDEKNIDALKAKLASEKAALSKNEDEVDSLKKDVRKAKKELSNSGSDAEEFVSEKIKAEAKAKKDAKVAAEKKAKAEAKAKREAAEKARKEAEAKKLAAEKAKAEKAKAEAKAAAEKARKEAELKAAAEKAKAEKAKAEAKAAAEKARKEAEAKAAAEKARKEADRKARIEAETKRLTAERTKVLTTAQAATKTATNNKIVAEKALAELKAEISKAKSEKKPDEKKIETLKSGLKAKEAAVDAAEDALSKAEKSEIAASKSVKAARDEAVDKVEAAIAAEEAKAKAEAKKVAAAKKAAEDAAAAKAKAEAEKAAAEKKVAIEKAKAEFYKELDRIDFRDSDDVNLVNSLADSVVKLGGADKESLDALIDRKRSAFNRKLERKEKLGVLQALERAAEEEKIAEENLQKVKTEKDNFIRNAKVRASYKSLNESLTKALAAEKNAIEEQALVAKNKKGDKKAIAAANAKVKSAKDSVNAIRKEISKLPKDVSNAQSKRDQAEIEKDIQFWTERLVSARNDYDKALAQKEKKMPGRHIYTTENISDEEVNARLARIPWIKFVGDRKWLAATSIDHHPLYKDFIDKSNPKIASELARKRAIDGGFYFAGFADYDKVIERNEAKKNSANANDADEIDISVLPQTATILVDAGRIGPIDVEHLSEYKGGEVPSTKKPRFSDEQIKRKMKVSESGIFNYNDIQKNFIALNSHPDIRKANIVFTPGSVYTKAPISDYKYEDGKTSPGNKDRVVAMNVSVVEKDNLLSPAHFVFGIDNFNSLGTMDSVAGDADTWAAHGTFQLLNLWQADHAVTVNGSYSLGGSLYGVSGSYYIPRLDRGWWDWSWTIHGGYTDIAQDDIVPLIGVEGTGYFAGISASKRLYESASSIFDMSVGATWRTVESALVIDGDRLDLGLNGEGYEILPVTVALSYSSAKLDTLGGRNYATIEGVYNVGGSSLEELQAMRQSIEEDKYWVARMQLARIQLLGDYISDPQHCWFLFGRLDGQYASDPLIGAEQYGLGGHNSIRGYAERQFLGDTGFSGTLELRTPIYVGFFSDYLGWGNATRLGTYAADRIQLALFFDFGRYTLLKGINNTDDDEEMLYSLGLGFRMSLSETLQLRLDWGLPLVKDDEKFETSSAGRIGASVSVQF